MHNSLLEFLECLTEVAADLDEHDHGRIDPTNLEEQDFDRVDFGEPPPPEPSERRGYWVVSIDSSDLDRAEAAIEADRYAYIADYVEKRDDQAYLFFPDEGAADSAIVALRGTDIEYGLTREFGEDIQEDTDPSRPGHCYELAGRAVLDGSELEDAVLVHGHIHNPFAGGFDELDHAWIRTDDLVWEPITETQYPKEVYYSLFQAEEYETYTREEMRTQILQTENWGPWRDDVSVEEAEAPPFYDEVGSGGDYVLWVIVNGVLFTSHDLSDEQDFDHLEFLSSLECAKKIPMDSKAEFKGRIAQDDEVVTIVPESPDPNPARVRFVVGQLRKEFPGYQIFYYPWQDSSHAVEEARARTYDVFIHKSYFPEEMQSHEIGKEDYEQWKVKASSRQEAADKIWTEHGERLLELMGPRRTKLPRKVSLYVSAPEAGQSGLPGRLLPVQVYLGEQASFDHVDFGGDMEPALPRVTLTRGEYLRLARELVLKAAEIAQSEREEFTVEDVRQAARDNGLTGQATTPRTARGAGGADVFGSHYSVRNFLSALVRARVLTVDERPRWNTAYQFIVPPQEEQTSEPQQDAAVDQMLVRYDEEPTNLWLYSNLPIKDRMALAYLAADNMMGAPYKEDQVRRFVAALQMTTQPPEGFWEQIRAKDPERARYLDELEWSLEKVPLNRTGVYPHFGGFPKEWGKGSVLDTAKALARHMDSDVKRQEVLDLSNKWATVIKFLPPILVPGGTLRGREPDFYQPMDWDIDDGNHRAVAAAIGGAEDMLAFVGRKSGVGPEEDEDMREQADFDQVDFGDESPEVVAYRLVLGDMMHGPWQFFSPYDALAAVDDILGTHTVQEFDPDLLLGWSYDEGWSNHAAAMYSLSRLIDDAASSLDPPRSATFSSWDRDFWLIAGTPSMSEEDLFTALDSGTALRDTSHEIAPEDIEEQADFDQVDFGEPELGEVIAYRLVLGDMMYGPWQFFSPEGALWKADEILGTHAAETFGDIAEWNVDEDWTDTEAATEELSRLIMATAQTQAEPERSATFDTYDKDFWLIVGPPELTRGELYAELDSGRAREDTSHELRWEGIQEDQSNLLYKKLLWDLLQAAIEGFRPSMTKAWSDPLQDAEVTVGEVTGRALKLGLDPNQIPELIQDATLETGAVYSADDDTFTIKWSQLPKKYQQRARIYTKTPLATEQSFDQVDFGDSFRFFRYPQEGGLYHYDDNVRLVYAYDVQRLAWYPRRDLSSVWLEKYCDEISEEAMEEILNQIDSATDEPVGEMTTSGAAGAYAAPIGTSAPLFKRWGTGPYKSKKKRRKKRTYIDKAVDYLLRTPKRVKEQADFDQVDFGEPLEPRPVPPPQPPHIVYRWILCKRIPTEEEAQILLQEMGFDNPEEQLGLSAAYFVNTWWGKVYPGGNFVARTTPPQPDDRVEAINLGTIVGDRVFETSVEATLVDDNTAWVEEQVFEDAIT